MDRVFHKVVLNVNGDLAFDAFQNALLWHPHSAGGNLAQTMGGEWNFTFEDYATMVLKAYEGKCGHIAAGTWWLDWAAVGFSRVPLNQAIASAFQDPNSIDGYSVKYTELDFYDSPQALSHPKGNIKNGGNIIFRGGDVVEFKYDSIPIGEWTHYEFNLTKWHEAAWGCTAKAGLLESVYIVVEVDCRESEGYGGTAYATVDMDNLWIYRLTT
jgi:hypothetical protein